MNKLFSNKKQEKGQGLVEYAIILALIAIVVIGVTTTLGKKVCNTMNGVGNSLDGSTSSSCGGSVAAVPTAVPTVGTTTSNVAITCPASGAVDVKNMSGGPNGTSFNCAAGSSYTFTVSGQTSGTILQFRNMYPPYNAVLNYTVP
ncbi:MAG: Flp family type IVb pilin [Chloroflexota bacterium]